MGVIIVWVRSALNVTVDLPHRDVPLHRLARDVRPRGNRCASHQSKWWLGERSRLETFRCRDLGETGLGLVNQAGRELWGESLCSDVSTGVWMRAGLAVKGTAGETSLTVSLTYCDIYYAHMFELLFHQNIPILLGLLFGND